ncbi:MAG: hypothetical protein ABIW19_07145, partial [Vicinamibacterales bacterium]
MKYLMTWLVLAVMPACAVFAQDGKADREVRLFLAQYENAVPARDIAFLERALTDDYVRSGSDGKSTNRAQALKYFRQQRANPTF